MTKKQSTYEYQINSIQDNLSNAGKQIKDKKEMFENFKQREGISLVKEIKEKVEMVKNMKSELNLCISACNDLKEKIDAKLKKVIPMEKRESKTGNEEEYKLQMDIRRLKAEHEEFLEEYKRLKKQYRQEDKNLLDTKRGLLKAFDQHVRAKLCNLQTQQAKRGLKNMDSAEIVFMNAKERFQTIKKLKKMEQI